MSPNVGLVSFSEADGSITYYLISEEILVFLRNQQFPKEDKYTTIVDLSEDCIQQLGNTKSILHNADEDNYGLGIQASIGSFYNDLLIGTAITYDFKVFRSATEAVRYANNNDLTITSEESALMY